MVFGINFSLLRYLMRQLAAETWSPGLSAFGVGPWAKQTPGVGAFGGYACLTFGLGLGR